MFPLIWSVLIGLIAGVIAKTVMPARISQAGRGIEPCDPVARLSAILV